MKKTKQNPKQKALYSPFNNSEMLRLRVIKATCKMKLFDSTRFRYLPSHPCIFFF